MDTRHPLLASAVLFLAGCASAPPAQLALSPADDAAIRELEAKSWVAWQAHDGAFYEHFLSDDHVEVHGYGIVGKAAVVKGVGGGGCTVKSYTLGPLKVQPVAADVVLVTYKAEQDSSCGPVVVPSPVWATSMYARRDGKWVNVLYQHTVVPK